MLWKIRLRLNMKMSLLDYKLFTTSPSLVPVNLLSPRETHFWYVLPNEVKSETLLRQYLNLLSPCEKEHVSSFQGDELRKNALLARVLVRTTIAKYANDETQEVLSFSKFGKSGKNKINSQISPRSLKFRKNAHGKPEVLVQQNDDWHQPPLHFNLSHSSALIACAVTMDAPIGIDVEEKKRRTKTNILSLARRYFSRQEVEFLSSISDPEVQRQEFTKLWTLKESYVKALGRGFSSAPFNTFNIRYKSATRGHFHHPEDSNHEVADIGVEPLENPTTLTTNWQFTLLELDGSHYAAICREKDCMSEGNEVDVMNLTAWKTIPLAEDTCVSGTDSIVTIAGLT